MNLDFKSAVSCCYKTNTKKYQVQDSERDQTDCKTTPCFSCQIASCADWLCMKKLIGPAYWRATCQTAQPCFPASPLYKNGFLQGFLCG